ncbi:MAG: ABC transporter substrate-binding protein [Luteibaculaceae bacterium]
MRIWYCILVMGFLTQACSQRSEDFSAKKVFRYNEAANISSLDPAFARSHENIWAVNHLFNGLVKMSNELTVEPDAAKSFSVDSTGLRYKFKIDTKIQFHPHESFKQQPRYLSAQDFVYSFNRLRDAKTASPGAWVFEKVKPFPDGFYAENDSTLVIELAEPWPVFLSVLTMQYCSVVPQEVIEANPAQFREKPIGTGPFKLFLWKENVKLVLHKNEHYFEQDSLLGQLPLLDAVSITFNKDMKSVFLSFLKNEYDLISGLDAAFKDEIFTQTGALKPVFQEKFALIKTPFLKTDYLGFAQAGEHPLVDDINFRKAVNFAIDKEKMVRFLRNNIGTPAHGGFIPKGMPGFNTNRNIGYPYNIDSAKFYLDKSTYTNTPLVLSATPNSADLCEYIQKALQSVGIGVTINIIPSSHHREQTNNNQLQFFRKNWLADYPDAENFMLVFLSNNIPPRGPNYSGFKDELFDKLYQKALNYPTQTERVTYYKKLDSLMMQQAPIVPLYYDEVVQLVNTRVKNLTANPINLLNLSKVDVKP